ASTRSDQEDFHEHRAYRHLCAAGPSRRTPHPNPVLHPGTFRFVLRSSRRDHHDRGMSNTTAPSTSFRDLVDHTSTALAGAPEGGTTTRFTVRGSLASDTNTQVDITAGRHEFTIDEPPTLGGADSGASPVEHLLAAL